MSKAVLLLDMPENCSACRMMCKDRNGYYCRSANICLNGVAWSGRVAGCPLRPLPDYRKITEDMYYADVNVRHQRIKGVETCEPYTVNLTESDFENIRAHDYVSGWNRCLDEIRGKHE